jgi:hypothetical protein
MKTFTRRRSFRKTDHIPILYAGQNARNYSPAVMINSSTDGMCFEANSPLQPQADLYIKVANHRPGCFDPERYKAFRARVKWCRQLTGDGRPVYGVGVRYTAKSHISYGINLPEADASCDCCEKCGTDLMMHRAESGLMLCPDCLYYFEKKPSKIEAVLERFLIGNVV